METLLRGAAIQGSSLSDAGQEPGPGEQAREALAEFERLRCRGVPTIVVNGQRYFRKDRVDWAIDACRASSRPA